VSIQAIPTRVNLRLKFAFLSFYNSLPSAVTFTPEGEMAVLNVFPAGAVKEHPAAGDTMLDGRFADLVTHGYHPYF
jgi:hypothetical protein